VILTTNVSVRVSPAARNWSAASLRVYDQVTHPCPSPVAAFVIDALRLPTAPDGDVTDTVCVSDQSRSMNLIDPETVSSVDPFESSFPSSTTEPAMVEWSTSTNGLSRSTMIEPSTDTSSRSIIWTVSVVPAPIALKLNVKSRELPFETSPWVFVCTVARCVK
jgi:hypothetical protein